ncbi:MAG: NifU family protein [bacterium]|nr:MAG: NifU family protein [bacterium]
MREKIESALDEIRPMLQGDGGDVELVDVNDKGVVLLRLQGACSGCPSAAITLKQGIERAIKEKVPEVTAVEAIE